MSLFLQHGNSLIVRSDIFPCAERISISKRFSVGSDDPVHRLKRFSESVITANGMFFVSILFRSSLIIVSSSTPAAKEKDCAA